MLAVSRAKAMALGLAGRAVFVKGDAEALDLPDASFDAALSLYAWRHLPNPAKAASEAFRVLRPGGRLVVAVGSGPRALSLAGARVALATPGRALAKAMGRELRACEHIDALVARLLPARQHEENAGWTRGHHEFSGSLSELLTRAGFEVSGSDWMGEAFEIGAAEDFWDFQVTFSSTARKRLAEASPAAAAALRAEFDRQCKATLGKGGRLVYRVGAAIVTAVKL